MAIEREGSSSPSFILLLLFNHGDFGRRILCVLLKYCTQGREILLFFTPVCRQPPLLQQSRRRRTKNQDRMILFSRASSL
jgi:hypothetical protein